MRLDARAGAGRWFVWHCRLACAPQYVVWVDNVSNRWGQYVFAERVVDHIPIREHQANKIVIYSDTRVVLIDPVEGDVEMDERLGLEVVR
jgi:hypothetical protein